MEVNGFKWMFFLVFAFLAISTIVISSGLRKERLQKYYRRPCTGFQWWRRFPNADKRQFRDFLRLAINAFGLRSKNCCILGPDDRVMDLYETLYPTAFTMADGLELETLMLDIEEKYRIRLDDTNTTQFTTFGDLFQLCHPQSA